MTIDLQSSQKNLYDSTFGRWVETTVELLRAQNYADVDWIRLIGEIADLSKQLASGLS